MSGDGVSGDGLSEASRVYLRVRQVMGSPADRSVDARRRRAAASGSSVPFGRGRDPQAIASVLDAVTEELGWTSPLERSALLAAWPELVGAETAQHAVPAGVEEGVLIVRCDSTAWATQLRIMRTEIVTRIVVRYPSAGISSVRFDGPGVPSWKRGPRSVPGRGPRDTYG